MNRRRFFTISGTFTGGALVLPDFLYGLDEQPLIADKEHCLVFVQLNGGNDGLNTFIPYDDPLYYLNRPNIALAKDRVISPNLGMAFHPVLSGIAQIQQEGHLSIVQNVGYPNPARSHFRSQEIWQTGSGSTEYLNVGWLGRYLDLQCKDHNPIAGVNLDRSDNLALRGQQPTSLTIRDPSRFKLRDDQSSEMRFSENPQLDFVRKVAYSSQTGFAEIQQALASSKADGQYPETGLGRNLAWISRLIKGHLGSKVFYTSLNGFDTHDNQLTLHSRVLTELNDALFSFYRDLKKANLLNSTTVIVFSEFGRRVKDNGKGTDHGTAAPVFIIGGDNKGQVLGTNPNLADLDQGDLKYQIDFRSLYGALLQDRLSFDPTDIGLKNDPLKGLF